MAGGTTGGTTGGADATRSAGGGRANGPRRRALRSLAGAGAALLAGGALGGCGFRPRGSGTAPGVGARVFVDADRGLSVLPELREALLERGFALAGNRDEADLLLRAGDESVAERIVSVQRTGRVSEYELIHEVNLLVARGVDGAPPAYAPDAVPNRVSVTREYTWDVTEVLGKENEARILKLELRRELVRQMVLRTLASLGAERAARPQAPAAAAVGSIGSVEANAREV